MKKNTTFESEIRGLLRALPSKKASKLFRIEANLLVLLCMFLICCLYIYPDYYIFIWPLMLFNVFLIGVRVMHSYMHGSVTNRKNNADKKFGSFALGLIAGLGFNWNIQHNVKHHTYTNIHGHDDDIKGFGVLRLSSFDPPKNIYGYQIYVAWVSFIYGTTVIYWATIKDFIQLVRYYKDKSVANFSLKGKMLKLILQKAVYFSVWLVGPIYFGADWLIHISCFFAMHGLLGVMLTYVFQIAHRGEMTAVVQESSGSAILSLGRMEHQLATTANFSMNSKFITWFTGGLNYQIEHHLFPNVHPSHYPELSLRVISVCKKYGVEYFSYENIGIALSSHLSELRTLATSKQNSLN